MAHTSEGWQTVGRVPSHTVPCQRHVRVGSSPLLTGGNTAQGFPCPGSLALGLWLFGPRRGASWP